MKNRLRGRMISSLEDAAVAFEDNTLGILQKNKVVKTIFYLSPTFGATHLLFFCVRCVLCALCVMYIFNQDYSISVDVPD